jgi:hypothetical protein
MPYAFVRPVINNSVRCLCARPYEGHPRGCPNFGHRKRCPPEASLLALAFDLSLPFAVIWSAYDLGAHVRRMADAHPRWSRRQLACCLYWQGTARRKLRDEVAKLREEHPCDWLVEETPEAMGCDVTATMFLVGVELPWPPVDTVYHVALAGFARRVEPPPQLTLGGAR